LIHFNPGRAIHTNYNTSFRCDTLKLAMIKTERLARRLFNGALYDCVCIFEPAAAGAAGAAAGARAAAAGGASPAAKAAAAPAAAPP